MSRVERGRGPAHEVTADGRARRGEVAGRERRLHAERGGGEAPERQKARERERLHERAQRSEARRERADDVAAEAGEGGGAERREGAAE